MLVLAVPHVMETRLKNIYYDLRNPASLGTTHALAAAAGIGNQTAQKFLKSQPTYTLHKQARTTRYPTRKYIVNNIDDQWQCDLMDLQNVAQFNNGFKYALTVIDILSRYGWVRPLKSKHGDVVAKAFKNIFREGRIPKRIQSDQGKEFENQSVRALFSRYHIELFSVKSAYKAAIVERWNRTLKTKLWKYFTAYNTYKWIDVIQDIVFAYNHRKHRTLGRTPASVNRNNAMIVWAHLYGRPGPINSRSDIQIGDIVRISKVKATFEKGYLPNWTEEIFTVCGINRDYHPITYKLKDLSGNVIEGSFYRQEIQPVVIPDDTYIIERILRKKRRRGVTWYYVKWLGYTTGANSWVRELDITHLQRRF